MEEGDDRELLLQGCRKTRIRGLTRRMSDSGMEDSGDGC